MASAAEQLAANMNFSAFGKSTELKNRIWFTIFALIVYRLGTYIPLPGIDAQIFASLFEGQAEGVLGMFNMFAGGAVERMSIFALSIIPYISASIIMQLMTAVSPKMSELKKEGESGRKQINQYTRYLTVVLASFQAYGIAVGLEGNALGDTSAVIDPGLFFRLTTVVTLVGGTVFLMWLGEQMTQRGIGNGISLLIFAGIVAALPSTIGLFLQQYKEGTVEFWQLLLISTSAIALVAFIVFMERAQRRVIVHYPKRQVSATRMTGGQSSHLPLKLNTAGVIPAIFASSLLMLPLTIVNFAGGDGAGFLTDISQYLQRGGPLYLALFAGLIVFFCFFYTAVVFNPEETADNLKRYNGVIPGIRPGQNTADFLDKILTRLTVLGAAYMAFVCVMPEYLIGKGILAISLGGTSMLIVVSVTLDTVAQIHSHMLAHQYEGLIRKSNLKGKKEKGLKGAKK